MEAAIEKAKAILPEKSMPQVIDEMIGALEGIDSEGREEQEENIEGEIVNSVNFVVDVEENEDQQVIDVIIEEAREERREKKRRVFKRMKVVADEDEGDLGNKDNEFIKVEQGAELAELTEQAL